MSSAFGIPFGVASELIRASFNSLGQPKPPQATAVSAASSSSSSSSSSKQYSSDDGADSQPPPQRVSYHRKLRDYLLLLEYSKLKDEAPPGVYVLPSEADLRSMIFVVVVVVVVVVF